MILILVFFPFHFSLSQEQIYEIDGQLYSYNKPGAFDFILNTPETFEGFGKDMFNSDYYLSHILIGTTTALFIIYDQPIYDNVSKWGRDWGIGNEDKTKTYFSIGGYPIFRGPSDWGSAMYFIGDGWLHLGICASFLTAGFVTDDNRALQTASQIAQGMITVGSSIQVLKHITGRETPNRATQNGGIWRFFPNQVDYHKKVPKYDAYPSGHVATAMMSLTIIANNYEEYKWIRPVGYSLITLLSFQMINNGVHWMSDYPLALGIGYLFGKIIVENGRRKIENENGKLNKNDYNISFYPKSDFYNSLGISVMISF